MTRLKFLLFLFTFALPGYSQLKNEKLKVYWPDEYKWKVIADTHDEKTSFFQMIPQDENSDWTILVAMITAKNLINNDLDQTIKFYSDAALKESLKAKVTVLERNDTVKNFWFILKVETTDFPNDPVPESNLYFIQQGNYNHFAAFVAIRKKELPMSFVDQWVAVFKKSELVYE